MGCKDMSKVAVVVPVFRVEIKYLTECIESILNQSLDEIELILVDDGAPGACADVCDSYAAKDSRVRVIHQDNQGVSAARNAGIEQATAKWIMFVDSDDYIDRDNCLEVYKKAEESDLTILLWGSVKFDESGQSDYVPYVQDIPLFSDEQKQELQYKILVGTLPSYHYPSGKSATGATCSKLYRRDFLIENKLQYNTSLVRAEDVNFNMRCFQKAERIGYLNRKFYYYRQLKTSAIYRYHENGLQVFTDALLELERFGREYRKEDRFWQIYYMRCIFFLLESIDIDYCHKDNQKSYATRMRELRQATKQHPYNEAICQVHTKGMSFAKSIPVYLLKWKQISMLCLFYRIYHHLGGK